MLLPSSQGLPKQTHLTPSAHMSAWQHSWWKAQPTHRGCECFSPSPAVLFAFSYSWLTSVVLYQ